MKKIYYNPVCDVVLVAIEKEILAESYNYGGAGTYGDDDVVDNGNY